MDVANLVKLLTQILGQPTGWIGEAYIINLDLKKSIKIGKTRLTFLLYYALMFKTL